MCSSEVGPGPGGGGGVAGDGSGDTFARPFGARSCLGMRRSTQRHPATSLACVCLCCGFCCEPLAKPPIQCVWRGRTLTQCWHTPDVANSRKDAPRSRLRVWVGGGASGAGGQHGSGGRSLADDRCPSRLFQPSPRSVLLRDARMYVSHSVFVFAGHRFRRSSINVGPKCSASYTRRREGEGLPSW